MVPPDSFPEDIVSAYESMGGTVTYDENGDAKKPFTIETFKDGALTYYGSF